jgi:predicted transcriptional regulator
MQDTSSVVTPVVAPVVTPVVAPVSAPVPVAAPISAIEEMKSLARWVCWRREQRQDADKPTKIPYQPNGYRADVTAPQTWRTFAECTAAAANPQNKFDGVGWVIAAPYIGIDLDHCISDGVILPTAQEVISSVYTYAEYSPSGTGVHLIAKTSLPPQDGKKKKFVEVYNHARYFTFTGKQLPATPQTINVCSENYFTQVQALNESLKREFEQANPQSNPPASSVVVESDKKFHDLQHGDWETYYGSQSEAVRGFLCMLAHRTNCDAEEMDEQFRASGLYSGKWTDDDKWSRLGEKELAAAIALVEESAPAKPSGKTEKTEKTAKGENRKPLVFTRPAVLGTHRDYVLKPLAGEYDGWFVLGDVNTIGGSSGNGKTTLMVEMLRQQKDSKPYFGHDTCGLPYLILCADRGKNSTLRTLERMKIDPTAVNMKVLLGGIGRDAAVNIKRAIEAEPIRPAIVFVEGADMLVEDAGSMKFVVPFLDDLLAIAGHYHIAMILSCGAPKLKNKEKFISTRDNTFGSIAWSRKSETMVTLFQGAEKGKRVMCVDRRNGAPEEFPLMFRNGVLVIDTTPPAEPKKDDEEILQWCMSQSNWFTTDAAFEAIDKSEKTVRDKVKKLCKAGVLEKRPIKGKHQFEYRAKVYSTLSKSPQEVKDETMARDLAPWTPAPLEPTANRRVVLGTIAEVKEFHETNMGTLGDKFSFQVQRVFPEDGGGFAIELVPFVPLEGEAHA